VHRDREEDVDNPYLVDIVRVVEVMANEMKKKAQVQQSKAQGCVRWCNALDKRVDDDIPINQPL